MLLVMEMCWTCLGEIMLLVMDALLIGKIGG